ncbi:hypothetical protein EV714DRAFT_216172, partial [Schizophyllum commune]
MSSLPNHSHPSAALDPPPTHADPLVGLWCDAVASYERETRLKLSSLTGGSPSLTLANKLDSAEAIFTFLRDHESAFRVFREDGAMQLSRRFHHIFAVVGTLSSGIGEGAGVPFEPAKAIFAAVGELIKARARHTQSTLICGAALAVRNDFDAIYAAFETMEQQLRIIQPVVGEDLGSTLREPSVKLLAQILEVLGVITRLQNDGRFRTWLKKLAQSKVVSTALEDLHRLSISHHQAVSAITLVTAQKTLAVLLDSVKAQDQDVNRRCLVSIAQLAQEVYGEILRSSSVTSEEILTNRSILESLHSILLNHVSTVKNDKSMAQICTWLQFQDQSRRLNDLLRHRAKSTGSWFLDSEDFAGFKSGSKRALWLQGKAGCGKSTLIAGAVQDLRAYCACQDPQSLVLLQFFDATNGSHARDLRALLSSLLCQLAQLSYENLSALLRLCEDNMHGMSQPTMASLQHQVSSLMDNSPGPVFVVVDALDEAEDDDVVGFLAHLRMRVDVHLLLSSRGEVHFHDRLHDLCDRTIVIQESAVKGDIDVVLLEALSRGGTLEKIKEVDLVREALETGSDGSFRWTMLQMKALSLISGIPTKVRERLKTLPKTLSETYERSLQAIDPNDRADVHRLLTWLLMTRVPLSTTDFAQLLSFDYSKRLPVFDAQLQPSPSDTLMLVGSTFVSVHDDKVRFAHASVRDFILALPPTSEFHVDFGLVYASMARTGLAYISA